MLTERRALGMRVSLLGSTATAALLYLAAPSSSAFAQNYTWGGTGSTTMSSDYNAGTNWSTGGPPVAPGQSATFDTTGNTTVSEFSTISPDAWTITAAAQSFSFIGGGLVQFQGSGLTNNATADESIAVSLGGTGGITQAGSGTLTLSAQNPYTGPTTITAGTLAVVAGGSITKTSGIALNGGALSITGGGTVTTPGDTTLGSGAGQSGSATVDGMASSLTTSTMTVGDNGTGSLTISNGGTVTIGGGAGTLNMAAEEGSSGTLIIGAPTGQAPVGSGSLLASAVNFGSLGNGSIVFNHTDTGYTFAPNITGSGAVVLDAGTTILTGNNSYTQGTTLNGGILGVGSNSALGSGAIIFNGGTLQAEGNFTAAAGSTESIINAAGGTIDANGNTFTFAGGLGGSGPLTVESTGAAGTVVLSGTNSYMGATTVATMTTLQAGAAGAFSPSSAFTLTGSTSTLDLNGNNNTIASLAGTAGTVTSGAGGAATLTLGAATGSTTFGGTFVDGSGGALSLVKAGAGTQVLTGTSSYSGGTTIQAGLLSLQGNSGAAYNELGMGGVTFTGGALELGGANSTLGNNITVSAGDTGTVGSPTGVYNSLSGAITLGNNSTLVVGNSAAGDAGIVLFNTTPGTIGTGTKIEIAAGTLLNQLGTFTQFSSTVATTQVDSGATLDLQGHATTILSLVGGGAILNDGGATTIDGTATGGFSGKLTGTQDVTFTVGNGTGMSVLTAVNDYTGGTTVDMGAKLEIASGGKITSSSMLTNSGTLQVDAGGSATFTNATNSGTIINNGTFTDAMTNTGTITNNMTYNGDINNMSPGTITNTSAGTWNGDLLSNNSMVTNQGMWNSNGSQGFSVNSSGGTVDNQATWTNTSGPFQNQAGGTFMNSTTASVLNGGLTNAGTTMAEGQINGTIANSNQFTVTGALTTAGSFTNNPGGTLAVGTNSYSLTGSLTNQATVTVGTGGTLSAMSIDNQAGATLTSTGTITASNGLTNGGTVNAAGTLNSAVTNTNAFNVTGTLTDNGSTFANNAGTLAVGANSFTGIGALTNAGAVTVGTGGTLGATSIDNTGMFTTTGTVNTTGGFTNEMAGTVMASNMMTGNVTNYGSFTLTGTLSGIATFDQAGGTLALGTNTLNVQTFEDTGGTITGTGTINASTYSLGSGTYNNIFDTTGTLTPMPGSTVVLNGANTYSGGTNLPSGTTIVVDNSTVTGGMETSSSIGTGPLNFTGGTLSAAANNLVFANTMTIGAPSAGSGFGGIIDTQGNTFTWNGTISGAGSLDIVDSTVAMGAPSNSVVVLGGANDGWSGNTTVDAGTISIGANNNLGAPNTVLTLDNNTGIAFTNSFTFTHPVVVNGDPTFNVGTGMTVNDSAQISGSGDVVKTGGGTYQLSNNNDNYTGNTKVQGGTLEVTGTGAITQSASLTVAAGTTFQVDAGGLAAFTGTAINGGTGASTNAGTLTDNGTVSFAGSFANSATVMVGNGATLTAGMLDNQAGATLTSTGTVGTTGGLTNEGMLNLAGTLNGPVTNSNAFNVTGPLVEDGTSTVTNAAAGTITIGGTSFTNIGTLNNAGTVTVSTGMLGATTITNMSGGMIMSGGTVTATTIGNNAGATFTSTGTVTTTNGFTNAGIANFAGILNGPVTNSNAFNVTGPLMEDGTSTVTNTAAGTITIGGTNFTNIGTLNNAGTVTVSTGMLGATTITNMSGGKIMSGGTVTATTIANNAGATFTSTGIVTATGGFTNAGAANMSGTLSAPVANQGAGVFTVTGNLLGNNTFMNTGTAVLNVTGGNYTGLTTLTNSSTASPGVLVAAARTLQANAIANKAGATFTSTGTVVTTTGFTNDGTANFAGTLTGPVTNDNGGLFTVTGALMGDATSAFTNNQGGTLAVGGQSYTSLGMLSNSGTVTIASAGTLGAVTSVTNNATGVFAMAGGTVLTPIFNNLGAVNVLDPAMTPNNVAFGSAANPTVFNNSGTINMQNGTAANPVVGDVTTINGTYNATGGATLKVDEQLTGTGSADRLVITGAGSGNTTVAFSGLTPSGGTVPIYQGGTLINPTPVVVGGNGATFTPTTGMPLFATNGGIVQYSLVPQAGGGYDIVSSVNTQSVAPIATALSSTFSSIATNFFQPISAIIVAASGNNPDTWTGGPWIRFNDSSSNTFATGTDSVLGMKANSDVHTVANGFQAGVDTGAINIAASGWNAHMGFTTGLIDADAQERIGPPLAAHFNVPFVGVYTAVRKDTFSADVTYLHDFVGINVADSAINAGPTHINGAGDSITGNVAYAFNVEEYSVEPAVSASYAHFKIDPLAVSVGAPGALSFNKLDSLLGRVGVQVGRTFKVTDSFAVKPFTTLAVWHEFAGNTNTLFSDNSGAVPVSVSTNRIGTFGQASFGIAGQTIPVGLTTFARFDVRFGERVDGVGGSIGGRYSF